MLREKLTADLKTAMLAKNEIGVHTIRLINAAIKQKDIDGRTAESREGIGEPQILSLLQTMIKQRQESIKMYEQGKRQDLADKEAAEIKIIENYMPKQLSDDEMKDVVAKAIAAAGASSIKDMGKVMNELKAKYSGQMDFAKAGGIVKEKLAGEMLKPSHYVSTFAVGALLILGAAKAFGAEGHHHSHHSHHSATVCKASPRWLAQKIRSFKPGDSKSEARNFDFRNYSFVTLDDAARRLFPSGTKLSYVDKVLKERGRAVKSQAGQDGSVQYDYHFNFGHFDCTRTVSINVDGKTKHVLSAWGNGWCG